MTIRIAMWSGPRNISTAMMRSFGARSDCAVSDEPFYGAYLKHSGAQHPMAAETIADMDCDWQSVLRAQSGKAPGGAPVWYQKHMPHHMVGPVSIDDMPGHRNAFLIRAPERVVASYRKKNELRSVEELGFAQVRDYFEREADRLGSAPPVVDSDAILAAPAAVLSKLCEALGIAWDPEMLGWAQGPHAEDGVWGAHWYDAVNASTGFGPPPGDMPDLDGEYARAAEACRADYEALARHAISA
ncbi:HAD family hydrolase [Alteriqipengyuania flavescens]|uniref:sulfotransferase-like domain-containing protein n=1 Tax=Alteriqipengyuania flavescens TaxID=3053610 RepID=UPI0025B455EB|nr:HAD family hydrolase [Alteriqipengyuania flavescens]WJY18241.1 HAD family hydrolase [Alteriqipengyuania flavescens]WJY24182.1 HAD family hydrolase [Alteriqipengyuania flavescens]